MTVQILEGDELHEIAASDLVKCLAVDNGFAQSVGEVVKRGEEVTLPGSTFSNGKPSWLKIIGVFGGKVKEVIEVDETNKKAPKKAAVK